MRFCNLLLELEKLYLYFACMYVYLCHMHIVPMEAREGHEISWNWSSETAVR